MKKGVIVLLYAVFLSLASCSLDDGDVNFRFVPLQIVSVELPDSFELNETYEVAVTVLRPNGCTNFEGFDISRADTADTAVRNVVAIGAELDNEQCTQATEEMDTMFSFVVLYTQDYLFRFYTGEDENGVGQYLEVTVPVNQ